MFLLRLSAFLRELSLQIFPLAHVLVCPRVRLVNDRDDLWEKGSAKQGCNKRLVRCRSVRTAGPYSQQGGAHSIRVVYSTLLFDIPSIQARAYKPIVGEDLKELTLEAGNGLQ